MKKIKIKGSTVEIASFLDVCDLLDSNEHFDLIWNLASEISWFAEEEKNIATKVLTGEIVDMSIPELSTFSSQLKEVASAILSGQRVLVHCLAGHGRTGMAVAILKKILENCHSSEALSFAHGVCHGPETQPQKRFVELFKL